jgi:hypothetical protein
MHRISLSVTFAATLLVLVLQAVPARAQATRTWVSGVGDDANPCSRTAPCKTFAGAISKTAPNGEIDCLDPGGFGAVTITKSITIDCGATFGSVLAAGTNGININGAGINVTLRNIEIQGVATGLIGINFIAGASLRAENMTIQAFNAGPAIGILFAPNSANAVLLVNNSYVTSNGLSPSTGAGIFVQPAAGGNDALVTIVNSKIQRNGGAGIAANSTFGGISMTIRDSTIASNVNGGINSIASNFLNIMVDRTTIDNNSQNGILSSGANSTVRINNSVLTNNATGVASAGGGVLKSYKNNAINGNGIDGTPIAQELLN